MKNEKAAVESVNDNDKRFEYAATVALNHRGIRKNPQRMSKIKSFIQNCNCKGINYLSVNDD